MVREGRILTNVTANGKANFGANFLITAYEVGAQVATGSSGTTATVRDGHGFVANDKFIVGTDPAMYNTVTVVAGTTLTLATSMSLSAGDILVNLGLDTGVTAPNYDGSGSLIYTDMDYSTLAVDSTVQATDTGRYIYWRKGRASWELVRSSAAVPFAIYQDTGAIEAADVLNVKDFDAVGDGVTDDTSAIQDALDAVPSTGGKVYFPSGTYIVSTAPAVKSYTHVYGDGMDVSIIKRKANLLTATAALIFNNACLITGPAQGSVYTNGTPGASITVSDLTLDGNYTNETLTSIANGAYGFSTGHTLASDTGGCVDGLTLQRVKVQNTMQDGIYVSNCNNVLIDSCVTYKTGQSAAVTNKNAVSITGGPTDLGNGWCQNFVITNNRISYSGDATTRGAEGIACIIGDNLIVSGNDISHVDYGFEGTYTTSGSYTNYNWTISNNTIHDLVDTNIAQIGIAIARSLSQPLFGVSVTGNTIYNVNQNGILTQYCSDLSVTGNVMRKVNIVTDVTYFVGIDIQICSEATCVGNSIYHVSPVAGTYGLRFYTTTGGVMSGNAIINDNVAATGANIYLTQDTVNCLVIGNRSLGNKYGVRISANGTNTGNTTIANYITGALTQSYINQGGTNYDFGSVDTGTLTIPGVLTTTGAQTVTGGISGGIPRNVGTWTINTVGAGTGTTPATTNIHTGSIFVPENCTITGINYVRGSAVAGAEKVIVQLFNSAGTTIAHSALAGTAVGTASQLQAVPFTATYAAVGPGYYHVGVQFDTATAALFQTIPAYCNAGNGVVGGAIGGQTFGTAQNVTPLTTFTANQVPVASIY